MYRVSPVALAPQRTHHRVVQDVLDRQSVRHLLVGRLRPVHLIRRLRSAVQVVNQANPQLVVDLLAEMLQAVVQVALAHLFLADLQSAVARRFHAIRQALARQELDHRSSLHQVVAALNRQPACKAHLHQLLLLMCHQQEEVVRPFHRDQHRLRLVQVEALQVIAVGAPRV